MNAYGQVRIVVGFARGALPSSNRFVYLFCQLDLKTLRIIRMWLVPSPDFDRLASRFKGRSGLIYLAFTAGDRSKWDRYLVVPQELGARLLETIEATKDTPGISRPMTASLVIKPSSRRSSAAA